MLSNDYVGAPTFSAERPKSKIKSKIQNLLLDPTPEWLSSNLKPPLIPNTVRDNKTKSDEVLQNLN